MDIISRAFWSDMEETMMFIKEGIMPVAQYDKMLYTDIVFVEQLWAKALDKARRKH